MSTGMRASMAMSQMHMRRKKHCKPIVTGGVGRR